MDKEKFLTLKKQTDKLLKKAEDEALEEGVDITSDEFLVVFRELKKKILAEKGIELEDYENIEKGVKLGKGNFKGGMIEFVQALGRDADREVKERNREFQLTLQEVKQKFSDQLSDNIDKTTAEFKNQIANIERKSDIEKNKLRNEIQTLLTELDTQKSISNKQIEKIKELEDKFYREAITKDRKIDEIEGSLKEIPNIDILEKQREKDKKELEEDIDLIGNVITKFYEQNNKTKTE